MCGSSFQSLFLAELWLKLESYWLMGLPIKQQPTESTLLEIWKSQSACGLEERQLLQEQLNSIGQDHTHPAAHHTKQAVTCPCPSLAELSLGQVNSYDQQINTT